MQDYIRVSFTVNKKAVKMAAFFVYLFVFMLNIILIMVTDLNIQRLVIDITAFEAENECC